MPSSPWATWPDSRGFLYHFGGQHRSLALSYTRSSCRRRATPCGAKRSALAFSALVLIRIMLQGWDAPAVLTPPRVSHTHSRHEPPRRRGSGHRRVHGPASGTRGLLRVWLAPHDPLRFLARCAHWKVLTSWDPAPPLLGVMGPVLASPHPPSPSEQVPTDLDEDDVVRPRRRAIHPGTGRDGSRPRVHALPDAVRRSAIQPAGRLLTLASLEALVREDGHGSPPASRPSRAPVRST
jgi:hypothetical protein